MEYQPKKLISRIFEFAAVFALSAFLLRLGVCYLKDVRWALLIIAILTAAAVIGYRVWKKNKTNW